MRTVASEGNGTIVNPMKKEKTDTTVAAQRGIKVKPEVRAVSDESKKRFVKHASRVVKVTFSSSEKVKIQTTLQKKPLYK